MRSFDVLATNTLASAPLCLATRAEKPCERLSADTEISGNVNVGSLFAFPSLLSLLLPFTSKLSGRTTFVVTCRNGSSTRRALDTASSQLVALERRALGDFILDAGIKIKHCCALGTNTRKYFSPIFSKHASEGQNQQIITGPKGSNNVFNAVLTYAPDVSFFNTGSDKRGGSRR